jgi:hypothetical protein
LRNVLQDAPQISQFHFGSSVLFQRKGISIRFSARFK